MGIKNISACVVAGSLVWNSAFASLAKHLEAPVVVEINAETILRDSNSIRDEIARGLNDERVLQNLGELGIKKSEVQMRLAAMSDQELLQIQKGVDRQVGGDVVTISVTTLLLIIVVILLVR